MKSDTTEKQTRVAFYLRVSTEDQVEKHGLDVQREALEGLVQTRGKLEDGRPAMVKAGDQYIYIDDGVSGTIPPKERPAYARLLEDLVNAEEGKKPFDTVAVFRIDRFARRLKLLLEIVGDLENEKTEFVSVTEGVDTSTPFGRAMLGILGVIAELELETTKSRTASGRKTAAQKGVVMGANARFGYVKDENKYLQVFEPEAKIVKDIYDMFLFQKMTPQQVADQLMEADIPSPSASAVIHKKHSGKKSIKTNPDSFWRPEAVKTILTDEIYIGLYYGNRSKPKSEWVLADRRHTPIIPKQIFDQTQVEMEKYRKRIDLSKKKKKQHLYLLSGLLRCHQCGDLPSKSDDLKMWIGDRKKIGIDKYSYYYKCGRKNRKKYTQYCNTIPIPAEEIEKYVMDFILELIKNPKAVFEYHKQLESTRKDQSHQTKRREQTLSLLNALPGRRLRVLEQREKGHITEKEQDERLKDIEADKKRYEQTLEEIDNRLSKIGLSEGYFQTFQLFAERYGSVLEAVKKDNEQLYTIIHQLVSQIVVYSRQVTEKDAIAGRKTQERQYIPQKIDIHLNLPQHLLQELYTTKFGVKKSKR